MIPGLKKHSAERSAGLLSRLAQQQAARPYVAGDHDAGDHRSAAEALLDEDFSRVTAPSLHEVLAELGRILLCSLGLAALFEIIARVAGFH